MVDEQAEFKEKHKTVRFPESMVEAMEKRRDETGVPVAEIIRRAVNEFLIPSGDADGLPLTPVLGPIPAGSPEAQEEYVADALHCSKHPQGPEYAYVHVRGDSMDKVVPPGAYALVRKMWAMPGKVIAARLTMPDGSVDVTLKRLRVGDDNQITLEPDSRNDSHKPIVLSETKPKKPGVDWMHPECAEIMGVFTGDYVVAVEK